jgi:hypothetical protein
MVSNIRPGAVIFTGDHKRLANFYEAITGLTVSFADDKVTVLRSDSFVFEHCSSFAIEEGMLCQPSPGSEFR